MSAQADLLSYLGQQLIAHGAVLFAILTAALTFMGRMRPRVRDLTSVVIYIGIAGVLTGAALYTLCRMLFYGALVDSLMIVEPPRESRDLWSYLALVTTNARSTLNGRGGLYKFIALFSSSINYTPTMWACFFAGCSIALAIYSIQLADGPETGATECKPIILSLCALCADLALGAAVYGIGKG